MVEKGPRFAAGMRIKMDLTKCGEPRVEVVLSMAKDIFSIKFEQMGLVPARAVADHNTGRPQGPHPTIPRTVNGTPKNFPVCISVSAAQIAQRHGNHRQAGQAGVDQIARRPDWVEFFFEAVQPLEVIGQVYIRVDEMQRTLDSRVG